MNTHYALRNKEDRTRLSEPVREMAGIILDRREHCEIEIRLPIIIADFLGACPADYFVAWNHLLKYVIGKWRDKNFGK